MSDKPTTGRELLMQMDSERNHVEIMLRRCVDAAMREIAPDLRDIQTMRIAYRAAELATEHTAQSLIQARRVANTLAALTPNTPVIFPDTPPESPASPAPKREA